MPDRISEFAEKLSEEQRKLRERASPLGHTSLTGTALKAEKEALPSVTGSFEMPSFLQYVPGMQDVLNIQQGMAQMEEPLRQASDIFYGGLQQSRFLRPQGAGEMAQAMMPGLPFASDIMGQGDARQQYEQRIPGFEQFLAEQLPYFVPVERALQGTRLASKVSKAIPKKPLIGETVSTRTPEGLGYKAALEGTETATTPETVSALEKLKTRIRLSPKVKRPTKEMVHEARKKQYGAFAGTRESMKAEGVPLDQLGAAHGAERGFREPKPYFEPKFTEPYQRGETLVEPITPDDIQSLYQQIETSPVFERPFAGELGYERQNTIDAMRDLLIHGELPTKAERATLEEVFDKELIDLLTNKRYWFGERGLDLFMDIINLPRAIRSSWDLSAPLRQGLILSASHPSKAFNSSSDMLKALVKEKWAAASEKELWSRPNAPWYRKAKLAIMPVGRTKYTLTHAEEAFATRLTDKKWAKWVGLRQSERAYVSYLNRLRADVFDEVCSKWAKEGFDPALGWASEPNAIIRQRTEDLARYINWASGRGPTLGREGGDLNKVLNIGFWSFRYQTSKLLPFQTFLGTFGRKEMGNVVFGMDRKVWKQALRDQLITFSLGMTALTLAYYKLGPDSVQLDPRSADFGKIKIGNTRLDFWGGFQQYARFYANLFSGKAVSGSTQSLYDYSELPSWGLSGRQIPTFRFFTSKLNPALGFGWNIVGGKNYVGEEYGSKPKAKVARDELMPLFLLDLWEAIEETGLEGAFIAAPGVLGVGVQTYGGEGEESSDRWPKSIRGAIGTPEHMKK